MNPIGLKPVDLDIKLETNIRSGLTGLRILGGCVLNPMPGQTILIHLNNPWRIRCSRTSVARNNVCGTLL